MKKKERQYGSIADLNAKSFDPEKTYQFWLIKKNNDASYSEDKKGIRQKKVYPTSVLLKLEFATMVKNPKDNRLERRIVRHCAGETSIFKDEQSPDDAIPKNASYKNFIEGHIDVRGTETDILTILALDDRNASNPNRDKSVRPIYYMRDDEKIFNDYTAQEDAKFEAESYVRNPDNFDVVSAYARVILSDSEFTTLSANPRMIIQRMVGFAKNNPKEFMSQLENPALLRKHYVKEALDSEHITYNPHTNGIYFKSGELIHQTQMGLDVVNSFVDKISTDLTDKTKSIYETILEKIGVKKAKVKEAPKVVVEEKDEDEVKPLSDEEIETIIGKAKDKGMVTYFGAPAAKSFYYQKDTVEALTFKSHRKFKEYCVVNPDFYEKLKVVLG